MGDLGVGGDVAVAFECEIDAVKGRAFNLGGGPANAVSLRELLAHMSGLLGHMSGADAPDGALARARAAARR